MITKTEGRNTIFILARSKTLALYFFSYLETKATLEYKPIFLAKIHIPIFWVYAKYASEYLASVNVSLFYIQVVLKVKLKKL